MQDLFSLSNASYLQTALNALKYNIEWLINIEVTSKCGINMEPNKFTMETNMRANME